MANLKIDIKEFITLNGDKYDSNNSYTLTNIDEISKKVMNTFLSSKKDYGYHAIVRKCPPLYIKLLM